MPKAMKRVTFSYDDGITQDQRLIDLLNKYGMKGTFNINSTMCGSARILMAGDISVSQARPYLWELKRIYEGHEVAAHGLTHGMLERRSDETVIREIERDRLNLSDAVGYEVVGMAYPNGPADERIARLVREHTGIKYARMVGSTFKTEAQADPITFYPTAHHSQLKELYEITEKFIEMKAETPQILYIWGHAYEFDVHNTWNEFENYLKVLAGHDDIWYCTNREAILEN